MTATQMMTLQQPIVKMRLRSTMPLTQVMSIVHQSTVETPIVSMQTIQTMMLIIPMMTTTMTTMIITMISISMITVTLMTIVQIHLITMMTTKQRPFRKNYAAIQERDLTGVLIIDPVMLQLLQEAVTVIVSLLPQQLLQ